MISLFPGVAEERAVAAELELTARLDIRTEDEDVVADEMLEDVVPVWLELLEVDAEEESVTQDVKVRARLTVANAEESFIHDLRC